MSYPAWWNKTVTIYNRYEDVGGFITWYRTVLPGCFVKNVPAFVIAGNTGAEKPQTTIKIRKSEVYIPPAEWNEDDCQRDNGFTIQNGDIIVMGNISDDINEYESGKRSDDFINKYKTIGCITVSSFSINDFGALAHYKAVS